MMGQTVRNLKSEQNIVTINNNQLNSGNYLIKVNNQWVGKRN